MTRTGTGTPPAARIAWAAGGVLVPVLLWEAYKFAGPENGVSVAGLPLLPRTTDLAMPHVWTMLARLAEPMTSAAGAPPLWTAVLQNETGATILTTEPPETAYTNEYVEKALAELEADGVDTKGADYKPIDVTLAEGGN